MSGLYFEGHFPELGRRLEDHFSRVKKAWKDEGWEGALVLGGGYGRGEGGVMRRGEETGFSNDLDYFLFHETPGEADLAEWCRRIERTESEALGIDVEIKCLRADSMGDVGASMMFSDLVAGHVVVAGEAAFLEGMKERLDFSRIGAEEAVRLLWNRGSGLFFARCRMQREGELGFVIRNQAKAKLALGDAWLCLEGLYHPKARVREEMMRATGAPDRVKEWHGEGVEFKFHPVAEGRTWVELKSEWEELAVAWETIYLRAEEKRLGREIPDFAAYLKVGRLFSESSRGRNLALAARDRLKRGAWLRPVWDYPRGALMRALPCLLGRTKGGPEEAGRFLPGGGSREEVYARWWAFYA